MKQSKLAFPLALFLFGLAYAAVVALLPKGNTLVKVTLGVVATNYGISAWLKAEPESDSVQILWAGYMLTGAPMAVGYLLEKSAQMPIDDK